MKVLVLFSLCVVLGDASRVIIVENAPTAEIIYVRNVSQATVDAEPTVCADDAVDGPKLGIHFRAFLYTAVCYRRVLAGKRALRSHVRRVLSCETLGDCRQECSIERRFHCESFNYKLDPGFRSKGLCELMTKPIEAFDLDRDFVADKNYDFYEIDRNSLEPDCPETLKGPGLLHSGFLSSKPNWIEPPRKWDRVPNKDGSDRRFFDERFGDHGRRKEEPFIPYLIGKIHPDPHHQQYAGYGGHYYRNNDDYKNTHKYWHRGQEYVPEPSHKPPFDYSNLGRTYDDEYGIGHWRKGHWNESATGLALGASNYYNGRPGYGHGRSEEDDVKDCSSQRRPGMTLSSGAIRRSLQAHNVLECEAACFEEKEFRCVSYSYRYSSPPRTDNCFLSERPYRGLALSADSGSDVYGMVPRAQGCGAAPEPYVESECFWHVRSDSAVTGDAVKAALTVTGLGACEAECIRAQGFFCRGFSFRFDSPKIGDEVQNCLLTSSPPTSLPRDSWSPSPGHELYSRGNYGRGCEPALYDDNSGGQQCYLQYDSAAELIGPAVKGRALVKDEEACAQACSEAPFRCLSFSYNSAASDADNCLLSEIKLFDLQRGADYEHAADSWLFAFDLFNSRCYRKVQDTHHGSPHHHEGPAGASGSGYLPDHGHGNHQGTGPPYIPSGPSGPHKPVYPVAPPGPTGFTPNYPTGPGYEPGYNPRPDHPPPYKPDYDPGYDPSAPGYRPVPPTGYRPVPPTGYRPVPPTGYRPDYEPPGLRPPSGNVNKNGVDEENIIVSWDHYTVSGLPCRQGSACAKNQVTGHWACEAEGGEIGSWDYCCAPSHRCGYSEGFHKPWCYVGASEDQWRPCSEKYYPYHQHSAPHPSQGHAVSHPHEGYGPPPPVPQERPHGPPDDDRGRIPVHHHGPYLPEADRKYWDDLYRDGPKSYYDRYGNPLPGYTHVPPQPTRNNYRDGSWEPIVPKEHDYEDRNHPALGVPRYWPVAYLHKGPPPNVTYFKYNETDKHTSTEKYDIPPSTINFNFTKDKIEARQFDNERINNDTGSVFENVSKPFEVKVDNITANNFENDKDIGNVSKVIASTSDESKLDESSLKGIDGKIGDFSGSIEVLDIEDAKKGEKQSDIKTLEEELQIEAIGRLLASRRIGNLGLEKRSQKDLEAQHIAVDNDDKTKTERRGIIQRVTKHDIERDNNADRSLEMSETTYVRPPRVLATTETIRKAFVNGKVFYDATLREPPKEIARRQNKPKQLEETKAPLVIANQNIGKKSNIKPRNVNPVRRVRRIYKKRYNPEEVRRRLLEREKNKESSVVKNK